MNKKLMRIISAVMAICLLACMIVPAASAMPQESADGSIKRISVVINGDAKTRRGICWYTTEKCGSDVEVMPLAKYNGSFDGALKFSGTCTKWKENYCHKVLAENLEPDTKYVYRVGDASTGIWSNNGTFETACDGEEPFSFIALADVQAGNEINFTKSGAVQRTAMQVCPDAKFLMNAGDFVNDCNDQE